MSCHRVIMMLGCCIPAAVRISRWNRATSSASASIRRAHPLDRNRALIEFLIDREPDLAHATHAQKTWACRYRPLK